MKLKNKKTGKSAEIPDDDKSIKCAKILATFGDDEWELVEDYEEPKEHWFVDAGGEVQEAIYLTEGDKSNLVNFGNYFETEEEAEKAVEKLKAWKRLKDKGFRFTGFSEGKIEFKLDDEYSEFTYNGYDDGCEWYENGEVQDDLDLLFGGEKWNLK